MVQQIKMTHIPSADSLANDIREVHASAGTLDPSRAEDRIESFLARRLEGLSAGERLNVMEAVAAEFGESPGAPAGDAHVGSEALSRFLAMLLGEKASPADLSSPDLARKLADALNTIFDALNKLVGVINATLLGERAGEQTIRHVIGSSLEGESRAESLESYLDQINEAFLITMKALKATAPVLMKKVLQELDPEKISNSSGGFKFGPMRKAEYFDQYSNRYARIKKWFDSGRFSLEFMKEFERNCQKAGAEKR